MHTAVARAPVGCVFSAIKSVTPLEIPLLRTLFAIRSLPTVLDRGGRLPYRGADPLLNQMLASGFVMLAEELDRELVLGIAGQFWRLRGRPVPLSSASEFAAYTAQEGARAAISFRLEGGASVAHTVLRTETRVSVPDPRARRRFAAYWRVIQPGSGLIRRGWLRAVKRRAEHPF